MAGAENKPETDSASSPGAQSILEVAEQLFADSGFDSVSISDIAQRADVSKANIFHHFKSKEGLYLAVLKSACGHSARTLDEVERTSIPGKPGLFNANCWKADQSAAGASRSRSFRNSFPDWLNCFVRGSRKGIFASSSIRRWSPFY